MKWIFKWLLVAMVLSACTVTKRYHQGGWHVEWKHQHAQGSASQTAKKEKSERSIFQAPMQHKGLDYNTSSYPNIEAPRAAWLSGSGFNDQNAKVPSTLKVRKSKTSLKTVQSSSIQSRHKTRTASQSTSNQKGPSKGDWILIGVMGLALASGRSYYGGKGLRWAKVTAAISRNKTKALLAVAASQVGLGVSGYAMGMDWAKSGWEFGTAPLWLAIGGALTGAGLVYYANQRIDQLAKKIKWKRLGFLLSAIGLWVGAITSGNQAALKKDVQTPIDYTLRSTGFTQYYQTAHLTSMAEQETEKAAPDANIGWVIFGYVLLGLVLLAIAGIGSCAIICAVAEIDTFPAYLAAGIVAALIMFCWYLAVNAMVKDVKKRQGKTAS